ncbi:MAG: protease-like activity factor CPAF [Chlamydiia bacterium]|nr:protease-like activity factor CPAF [Chlamydiia bacterium]
MKCLSLSKLLVFFLVALSSSLFALPSQAVIKSRMLADLETIKNIFEIKYAPANWKKEFADWDLDVEYEAAKAKIMNLKDPTVKDFQVILKHFLLSTKDYHVGARFFSTEMSSLPFTIKGAEGRYFITHIDPLAELFYSFSLQVGDEVLEFGGKPIGHVIAELKKQELGGNTAETDQAEAEFLLTSRHGETGDIIPRGPISVKLKGLSDGKIKRTILRWDHFPERVKDVALISQLKGNVAHCLGSYGEFQSHSSKVPFIERYMVHPHFEAPHFKSEGPYANPDGIGAWASFLPCLGEKIWEGSVDLAFHAYIFLSPSGKKVGCIRIPHYMEDEEAAFEFCNLLRELNEKTDALVIDQLNNPGGAVFYLYALASMLTDRSLETPKHRIALTQEEVYQAVNLLPALNYIQTDADAKKALGETLGGYPVTMDVIRNLREFFRFVINEWEKGNHLTNPTFVLGVDKIQPHPKVQYTKPLLVLINERCYSCGDFFPAILQDNHRAVLFGRRTAGAGGYVISSKFPNYMGISRIKTTGSIAERVNKQPIENLGVVPDITYELTTRDLQEDYVDCVDAILETLERMLES